MIQQKPPKDVEEQKTEELGGLLLPDPVLQGLPTTLMRACFLRASWASRKGGHDAHFTDEKTEVLGTTSNCTNTTEGKSWTRSLLSPSPVFSLPGPKAAQLAHRIHLPLPPLNLVSVQGDFTVTITNIIPMANVCCLLTPPRLSTKYFASINSKFS